MYVLCRFRPLGYQFESLVGLPISLPVTDIAPNSRLPVQNNYSGVNKVRLLFPGVFRSAHVSLEAARMEVARSLFFPLVAPISFTFDKIILDLLRLYVSEKNCTRFHRNPPPS